MKFALECTNCILNQVAQVSKMKNLNNKETLSLLNKVKSSIDGADFSKTSPEIYGNAWKVITSYFDNEDLYKEIRQSYNSKFMEYVPQLETVIKNSENPLKMALATAIEGNLLDLAIQKNFSIEQLINSIGKIEHAKFGIDDSSQLLDAIKHSKKILYVGDNCGEIVFDRIFIETIKEFYPQIEIYYVVRGQSAVNDVLLSDALQVGMDKFAIIIENGDSSLGTVLDRCYPQLNKLYKDSDLVIAKGQGNYESLSEFPRNNLFYLLLTKCHLIAEEFNVEKMSIVCAKAKY